MTLIEQYGLTKGQKQFFEDNGYLILKNVLPPELLEKAVQKIDDEWDKYKAKHPDSKFLHMFDFVSKDDFYLHLMSLDETLIKVVQLLSPNIYLFHCHLDVHQPFEEACALEDLEWHRDSDMIERDLNDFKTHLFTVKASFWLSDVSEPNRGNMMVIPGSHKEDKLFPPKEAIKRAIPLLVNAGDAILFDRRAWHARSHNVSNKTRKVLFYGYSYRWIASRDVFERTKKTDNPVWNQLLGCFDDPISRYKYRLNDVPLRKIMEPSLVSLGIE